MDKTILLKTQLNEAAKLAKKTDVRYKRLSVILLDNFIEIQLRCLISNRLQLDGLWGYTEKKYKQKQRNKINLYYGELLKACVKEKIITSNNKKLLSFCHEVRNNLYHKINEEELLIKAAIQILYKIITDKQPKWGNGYNTTLILPAKNDPFYNKKNKDASLYNTNSEEEWGYFLNNYFNTLDRRKKNVQRLLSDHIINKINEIKSNIKFTVEGEFSYYFPYAEKWGFNEYCLFFSFFNLNKAKIEELQEDKYTFKKNYEDLLKKYTVSWKRINSNKLEQFKLLSNKIIKLSISDALEEYLKIKDELNMVSDAFKSASIKLDKEIQFQTDLARGK